MESLEEIVVLLLMFASLPLIPMPATIYHIEEPEMLKERIHKQIKRSIFIFALLVLFFPNRVQAAAYYVDYAGGSDTAAGTSTSTAWQHCPGDANATGTPASKTFSAGDIVYFKGGVTYAGHFQTNHSGSLLLTGTAGSITTAGVFTDSTVNFTTAGVAPGDLVYVYNSSTTGAYIRACELYSVKSVDSATQLTFNETSAVTYSGGDMTYRVIRPITYTSLASWGTGAAVISDPTSQYQIRLYNNYIRISGLTFQNNLLPVGFTNYTTGSSSCTGTLNQGAIFSNNEPAGLIVDNCTFSNLWGGVYDGGGLSYSVLKNNTATYVYSIVFMGGDYCLIEGNTTQYTSSTLRGPGQYSIIRNNNIKDAACSSSVCCGAHADGIGPLFRPLGCCWR